MLDVGTVAYIRILEYVGILVRICIVGLVVSVGIVFYVGISFWKYSWSKSGWSSSCDDCKVLDVFRFQATLFCRCRSFKDAGYVF